MGLALGLASGLASGLGALLLLHGGDDGLEDLGRVGVEVIARLEQDPRADEDGRREDEEGNAEVVAERSGDGEDHERGDALAQDD